jgi:hypothetical protein
MSEGVIVDSSTGSINHRDHRSDGAHNFSSVIPARHRQPEADSGEAGGSVFSVVHMFGSNG